MITCRIEISPHGDRSRSAEIAELTITNDGTGGPLLGNYEVTLDTVGRRRIEGRVCGFDRSRGAVALVTECLKGIERAAAAIPLLGPTYGTTRTPQRTTGCL